jgi:hypothetical protein
MAKLKAIISGIGKLSRGADSARFIAMSLKNIQKLFNLGASR